MNVLAVLYRTFSVYLTRQDVRTVIATSVVEMSSESGITALSDTRILRTYNQVMFTQVAVDVRLNDIRYS